MKCMSSFGISHRELLLIGIVVGVVAWIVLYFTVKAAVKNGMLAVRETDRNKNEREIKI